ncbi:MAG: hypothetical protein K6A36_01585 [Paludibacteraceae bacterium]|nr:hypothetical protein [Paludibacteraceae bacterium]
MKYFNQLRAAMALTMASLLMVGCHSDIDFNNIDGKAEVDMGLVLPIGTMSVSLKDVLGKVPNIYIDSLDNRGVITWKDTFIIDRNYHKVDLTKYISSGDFSLDVYDKVADKLDSDGKLTGTGSDMVVDFPLTLKLKDINRDVNDERLDSALIDLANFTSSITNHNMSDLDWNYIQKIELDLGERITRRAGNRITIYTKDGSVSGYGQEMPNPVDNFTICLMKNRNLTPDQWVYYPGNVVDECEFHCYITINIPAGTKVAVPNDAAFKYHLGVQFIDYEAIWGYFSQSTDMHDEDTLDFTQAWGDLDFIKKARLPFSDPKIKVGITTHVAGALVVGGDYLFTVDSAGEKHYAEFEGSHKLEHHFRETEYLDPVTSHIGDSTNKEITTFTFDKSDRGGRIDRLFVNMPQELAYNFNVNFDWVKTPQIRVTQNTNIRINAEASLPMIFNQGTYIAYSDTVKNVDLSKASIDSLLNDVELVDTLKLSDIKLLLIAHSTIPLQVKATFRCYDENGNMIMDPDDSSKPLVLFESDTLRINPPKYTFANGAWVMETTKSSIVASVSKKKLEKFSEIKTIMYSLWVDDESLDYAFKQGAFNVRLTGDSGLKLKIGLTAHVDAVLNLNETNNKD